LVNALPIRPKIGAARRLRWQTKRKRAPLAAPEIAGALLPNRANRKRRCYQRRSGAPHPVEPAHFDWR
jgi:hypothetical protein